MKSESVKVESFDIGLDREEIKTSPDFGDLPLEPPKKKSITKKVCG